MAAAVNGFKAALQAGQAQIGLWTALASPVTAEILGGSGFDWLVLDSEHGPNDLPLLLAQIQALAPFQVEPVIRPPIGETWMIKQLLDIGARTLLVPMIETADQARQMARAMRYPPEGVRGVGASLGRASQYNRVTDYLTTANAEVCLLLQVESRAGISAVDEIAATEGVDGVFIGPISQPTWGFSASQPIPTYSPSSKIRLPASVPRARRPGSSPAISASRATTGTSAAILSRSEAMSASSPPRPPGYGPISRRPFRLPSRRPARPTDVSETAGDPDCRGNNENSWRSLPRDWWTVSAGRRSDHRASSRPCPSDGRVPGCR